MEDWFAPMSVKRPQFTPLLLIFSSLTLTYLTLSELFVLWQPVAPDVVDDGLEYGVIVDAGSSGCRIRVFSWHPSQLSTLEAVDVSASELCGDVEPGISSYATDIGGAVNLLAPLIQCAEAHIPPHKHYTSPFYLRATAGVRLLPEHQQERLMSGLAEGVCKGVAFECGPTHFTVLSGEDEGLMLWLSINHLLKNFGGTSRTTSTVGVLDMGGASTQIAAATVPHLDTPPPPNTVGVAVDGYVAPQQVYTRSILGGGMSVARELMWLLLVERAAHDPDSSGRDVDVPPSIEDPCGNMGYSAPVHLDRALRLQPISEAARTYLGDRTTVTLVGAADMPLCTNLAKEVVDRFARCPQRGPNAAHPSLTTRLGARPLDPQSRWSGCSLERNALPPLQAHTFYSVSNYFYVARFFKLGETVAISEFVEHATALCEMKWEEALAVVSREQRVYLHEYCFRGIYLSQFLQHGLGFDPLDHISLHFVGELNHNPTDWSLGAMLAAIQDRMHSVATAPPPPPAPPGSGSFLHFLALAVALGCNALVLASTSEFRDLTTAFSRMGRNRDKLLKSPKTRRTQSLDELPLIEQP